MATKSTNRDFNKEQKWLEHLRQWQRSGLSQADFCRQEGVRENQFCYWRSALKKRGLVEGLPERSKPKPVKEIVATPVHFVSVDVKSAPTQVELSKNGFAVLEIVTPGGYVVRIP